MTKLKKKIKYLFTYPCKLWYDLKEGRMVSMAKQGIFTAKELTVYIKNKYKKYTNNKRDITPIKLQKALYFCFAYWAGFVGKGKIDNQISNTENQILFDDKIEAWSFGPVVPSAYYNEKLPSFFQNEKELLNRANVIFHNNTLLKETIDSILNDIFEISDFKLVSLSHMDKSWQNHFNQAANKHNEEIPKEEIINEYTAKEFN